MNSGPPIFNEICSALRAARLSSRKGLGELISKRRGLPGVQAFFGVRRSSARLLVQIPGSVAKMSCAAIARHAALGTAWLSLSLGAFAAWVKVKNPKAPGSEGRGRRGVRTNTQPLAVDLRLFIAPTREYASPSPTSCPVRRRWLRASSRPRLYGKRSVPC